MPGLLAPERVFISLPPTPRAHFSIHFYAVVARLLERLSETFESPQAAIGRLPFLAGYQAELEALGIGASPGMRPAECWRGAIGAWERDVPGHLPLRALRQAAELDNLALQLLVTVGLAEEDARFGGVFELLQAVPGLHRPTYGLLTSWWCTSDESDAVRQRLRHLCDLGLLQPLNPEAPRGEWTLQVPNIIWEALRGEAQPALAPWAHYACGADLLANDELVLDPPQSTALASATRLLADNQADAVIVRGPRANGRRTLLGAIARALGRGLLQVTSLESPSDPRWNLVGPLATLLHALPAIVLEPGPGETIEAPALPARDCPVGIVLARHGGLVGPLAEHALTMSLSMPSLDARRQHWLAELGSTYGNGEPSEFAERLRLTSGNLRRAAGLARSYAALEGRDSIRWSDVQQASRALNRQALETLTARVPVAGDWRALVVAPPTLQELQTLERRCRHRERLRDVLAPSLGADLNPGVRALFSGPSGTGKTLAARLLASVLGMDLYRLDLSALVSKYIGETEKNLNQVFARAEELDVMLLLDEGDALLTQRTSVQTSNDRYANLETNYLLQRLESFEGILVVTTNAAQRIDPAFQRRMDVVIDFRPPDPAERWAIWQLHLPAEHAVEAGILQDIARRCALSGGQVRNAVLHASLLALEDSGTLNTAHLQAAVVREYRKMGDLCPLRPGGMEAS